MRSDKRTSECCPYPQTECRMLWRIRLRSCGTFRTAAPSRRASAPRPYRLQPRRQTFPSLSSVHGQPEWQETAPENPHTDSASGSSYPPLPSRSRGWCGPPATKTLLTSKTAGLSSPSAQPSTTGCKVSEDPCRSGHPSHRSRKTVSRSSDEHTYAPRAAGCPHMSPMRLPVQTLPRAPFPYSAGSPGSDREDRHSQPPSP